MNALDYTILVVGFGVWPLGMVIGVPDKVLLVISVIAILSAGLFVFARWRANRAP